MCPARAEMPNPPVNFQNVINGDETNGLSLNGVGSGTTWASRLYPRRRPDHGRSGNVVALERTRVE